MLHTINIATIASFWLAITAGALIRFSIDVGRPSGFGDWFIAVLCFIPPFSLGILVGLWLAKDTDVFIRAPNTFFLHLANKYAEIVVERRCVIWPKHSFPRASSAADVLAYECGSTEPEILARITSDESDTVFFLFVDSYNRLIKDMPERFVVMDKGE